MNISRNRIKEKLISIRDAAMPSYIADDMRRGKIIDLPEWEKLAPQISNYGTIDCDMDFKKLSQTLSLEHKIVLSVRCMWNIYNWVIRTRTIPGDVAEVGVFRGGSAKLIAEVKGDKKFYLFDTFAGMPDNDFALNKLKTGDVKGDSLAEVKEYLSKYKNLHYCPGIFPGSTKNLKPMPTVFSFVNLDADIYEATRDSLEFFYPRMSKGGVIIGHDYRTVHLPGVKKAFDEFFKDKPETLIELWDTQCLIVKL